MNGKQLVRAISGLSDADKRDLKRAIDRGMKSIAD